MSEALRQEVRERANRRCEYCLLGETDLPFWPFHLDHIVAGQHYGSTTLPENLAWACQRCNLHKGHQSLGCGPGFNDDCPALQPAFGSMAGARIEGRTTVGRATVWLLQMNSDARIELRAALQILGDWPPPG